jgi:hypothetical protein
MAVCSQCGGETELFVNGSPLCLDCVAGPTRDRVLQILRDDLKEASRAAAEASEKFNQTIQIPTGLPHPDGQQHIHCSGSELSVARGRLRDSLYKLNKFLVYGEIPEDLKTLDGDGDDSRQ